MISIKNAIFGEVFINAFDSSFDFAFEPSVSNLLKEFKSRWVRLIYGMPW